MARQMKSGGGISANGVLVVNKGIALAA